MSGKFLPAAKHMHSCFHSKGLKIELRINHPNHPSDTVQKSPSLRRPPSNATVYRVTGLTETDPGEHSSKPIPAAVSYQLPLIFGHDLCFALWVLYSFQCGTLQPQRDPNELTHEPSSLPFMSPQKTPESLLECSLQFSDITPMGCSQSLGVTEAWQNIGPAIHSINFKQLDVWPSPGKPATLSYFNMWTWW